VPKVVSESRELGQVETCDARAVRARAPPPCVFLGAFVHPEHAERRYSAWKLLVTRSFGGRDAGRPVLMPSFRSTESQRLWWRATEGEEEGPRPVIGTGGRAPCPSPPSRCALALSA
jgi:hypothetical protein